MTTDLQRRFDLNSASGPFKLDIGNTIFAPVAFYDPKASHLPQSCLRFDLKQSHVPGS